MKTTKCSHYKKKNYKQKEPKKTNFKECNKSDKCPHRPTKKIYRLCLIKMGMKGKSLWKRIRLKMHLKMLYLSINKRKTISMKHRKACMIYRKKKDLTHLELKMRHLRLC